MASCIDHLGILAATFLCLSVAVSSAAFSKETSPHDGAQSDLSGGRSMPVGVNGPMANIVVDQFGYPKNATKIAIIREPLAGYDAGTPYTPGHTFSVIERLSGNTVKSGAISSGTAVRRTPLLEIVFGPSISQTLHRAARTPF